jgi:hypothetical protein
MKSAVQALILLALPLSAFAANVVVPVDSVENHVNVRMEADAKSEIVGKLSQGDSLPFKSSVPGWHEVRLDDDAYGYISEDWADVITDEEFAARLAEDEANDEVAAADESDSVEPDEQPAPETEAVAVEVSSTAEEVVAADIAEPEPAASSEESSEEDPPQAVAEVAADVTEETNSVEDEEAEVVAEVAAEAETELAEEVVVPEETLVDAQPQTEAAETAPAASVALVPVAAGQGAQGPIGPTGPPGPPGPNGSSAVEGTEDFLMKFTDRTEGGNSQVFDDGRNVGIGTTEPKQRLEVNGNIQIHEKNSSVAGLMLTQSSGGMGYIMHNRADTLTLGAGSVDRLTIDRDGNVGIGTARPSHPIEMASGAYVSAGGVWTNSSSREKKDNIVALTPEEALAALVALEPVRFNYKQDESEEYVGFIAEDVPGLVASADRSSLSTMDIVAVLTRVVQEQQQKIAELEARLDSESR